MTSTMFWKCQYSNKLPWREVPAPNVNMPDTVSTYLRWRFAVFTGRKTDLDVNGEERGVDAEESRTCRPWKLIEEVTQGMTKGRVGEVGQREEGDTAS